MNNKKFLTIFTIIALVLGGLFYLFYPTPTKYELSKPGGTVCTQEAKLCPDGSYVSRHGPKCEFDPCPIPPGTQMEDGTIPNGQ